MPLKPFRDYSEHDVLNLFKFVSAAGTGDAGIPVVVSAGFSGSSVPSVASNLAAGLNNGNTYSPRWTITPAVTGATSGAANTLAKMEVIDRYPLSATIIGAHKIDAAIGSATTFGIFNFGAIEAKEDLLFCFCDTTLIFVAAMLISATSLSLQND